MQDFIKKQTDWLKTWQENQESLTKQYAGMSEEWTRNILGGKRKDPDFFEGWFKSQGDLEDQFREFGKRMNEMIGNLWSNRIPGDVLKFVNVSFFEEFYKNWLSNIELPGGIKNPLGMNGGMQQATQFLRSFIEKENPFFSSFSSSRMSDQMSQMFGLFQGALGQGGGPFSGMLSGYQDIFGKLFESSTAQSAEKLAEGFETWSKEIMKHLSAPKLGINREQTQEISQALVLSQSYMQSFVKMAQLVEKTTRKAGSRFQAKLSEEAIKNRPVTKFTDFCALWAAENEAVFLEVMATPEFAQTQGDFIDAGHRLKIQWNKLAEKALEPSPIALKRDLDLAIAEIHQLKRDMKTFKRELRVIEKDAQSAHDAQTVAAETAKKAQIAVKAAEAAAQEQVKKAKAAEAAAQKVAQKAQAAEAAALEKAKKAKAVADELVKKAKSDTKTVKSVKTTPKVATTTKSKKA